MMAVRPTVPRPSTALPVLGLAAGLSVGLSACAPPPDGTFGTGGEHLPDAIVYGWYEDLFTDTFEICGQPDEWRPWDPMPPWYEAVDIESLVDDECYDAITEDLQVTLEPDPETGDTSHSRGWRSFSYLGYVLLSWPLGTVQEARDRADAHEPWVSDAFVHELELISAWSGETDVRAIMYNLVMASIEHIEVRDPMPEGVGGIAYLDTRTVVMNPSGNPADMAPVLIHEATHLWLQQPHVYCPFQEEGDNPICDETWHGPYGFAAGYASLMADHIPNFMTSLYWDWIESIARWAGVQAYGYILEDSPFPDPFESE
ncbi:MAG: hypothetical protein D6798_07670 [Deltaproteobacteria bacterium]|nr:MAG: hypothetical protein D6798_07670 [Deltaproteobacteria bacterium]